MTRRLVAACAITALLCPWLIVLGTAVHLTLDHGHGGDGLAGRVAVAWHGHDHLSHTVPHEHGATPAEQSGWTVAFRVIAVTVAATAILDDASAVCRLAVAERSPPDPPPAFPPTLRV